MTPIAGTANAAALNSPLESQRNFRRRSMNVRTGASASFASASSTSGGQSHFQRRRRNAMAGPSPAASLPFSLVEVLPLERLRFREGPFRILHLLELLGDELDAGIHEVPDRGPNGLRSTREIVNVHEKIERLEIPRGQAQRDFFRVRIPQAHHPTRGSTRHVLTDERRTEQPRAI